MEKENNICPRCGNTTWTSAGVHSKTKKQRYKCRQCHYLSTQVFVENLREAPQGFYVKGTSTLLDEQGNQKLQWVKLHEKKEEQLKAVLKAIDKRVEKIPPRKKSPKIKKVTDKDLLSLYTISDFHLGMYAWGEESGDDFDLAIAEKIFTEAILKMNQSTGDGEAMLNILGDFLHWDGMWAQTNMSKHLLDADTRFPKLIQSALDLIEFAIEVLLESHKKVSILLAQGNHDELSSIWLAKFFKRIYLKEPRVEVIDSPLPYYAMQWGKTMLGFHHGHLKKKPNLPALFASEPRFCKLWGDTLYRYIHTGHLHHITMNENAGCIVEQHQTLAARDAYAARYGFTSNRGATVVTYSKNHGEVYRTTVRPHKEDV